MKFSLSGASAAATVVAITGSALMLPTIAAAEADRGQIIIIDRQQQSSPFGHYDSRRETRVFGPSGGFRYEEYSVPLYPVYPTYPTYPTYPDGRRHSRHDRDRRHDRRHVGERGRVIEHFGGRRSGGSASPKVRSRIESGLDAAPRAINPNRSSER